MTVYDSSVLIEYLDGDPDAIAYVENHFHERAVAPPLVAFEVYQGEVFKSGSAEFDAVDSALGWLTVIDATPEIARTAAEVQNRLHQQGQALAARDAFIAGTAKHLGDALVVADADFQVSGLSEILEVDQL